MQEITAANKASAAAQIEFSNIKEQRGRCFNETFEYVAGRIGHVYSDLTRAAGKPGSEGATLYRMNQEEPYADGVRFSAIPPGKRYMSMKDLSGGEKTIAALALLLAIHSYKPSPFFVFDEVCYAMCNCFSSPPGELPTFCSALNTCIRSLTSHDFHVYLYE